MASEQKIITASSPEGLSRKIQEAQSEGWECVGAHTAMQVRAQLKYAGRDHMATEHSAEYAQSVKRNIDV